MQGQNTTVLNYIKQGLEEMDQQIPIVNIDGEPGIGAVPTGVISVVVNETPNYGMALDHAMLSSDTSSVYVVSNRPRPRIKNHTGIFPFARISNLIVNFSYKLMILRI